MSLTVFGALRQLDEPRYRAEFYRAWALAAEGGLAHLAALEQMEPSGSDAIEEVRRHLLIGIRQDRPVATLVRTRPKLFDPLETAVLASGADDVTPHALRLLTDYYTREYQRLLRVRLLMGYPIFFGVVASFMLPLPILYRSGPRPYMIAIGITLAVFLLVGGVPIALISTSLVNTAANVQARFVRAFLVSLETAMTAANALAEGPPGRALRLAAEVSGSSALRRHLEKRSKRELQTIPLATLLDGCREVPASLLGQMRVADTTGDYLGTLRRYEATQLDP